MTANNLKALVLQRKGTQPTLPVAVVIHETLSTLWEMRTLALTSSLITSVGALPIPSRISISTMGIPVCIAKYQIIPTKEGSVITVHEI